jgi:hypothetical protein
MEVRAIEDSGKRIDENYVKMSRQEWIKAEIAKRCEDLAQQ